MVPIIFQSQYLAPIIWSFEFVEIYTYNMNLLYNHTQIYFIFIFTVFKKVNWHNTVNHGSHYFSKPILGSNYLKISILKGSLIRWAIITHISYFGLKCGLTEIFFICYLCFYPLELTCLWRNYTYMIIWPHCYDEI